MYNISIIYRVILHLLFSCNFTYFFLQCTLKLILFINTNGNISKGGNIDLLRLSLAVLLGHPIHAHGETDVPYADYARYRPTRMHF